MTRDNCGMSEAVDVTAVVNDATSRASTKEKQLSAARKQRRDVESTHQVNKLYICLFDEISGFCLGR